MAAVDALINKHQVISKHNADSTFTWDASRMVYKCMHHIAVILKKWMTPNAEKWRSRFFVSTRLLISQPQYSISTPLQQYIYNLFIAIANMGCPIIGNPEPRHHITGGEFALVAVGDTMNMRIENFHELGSHRNITEMTCFVQIHEATGKLERC